MRSVLFLAAAMLLAGCGAEHASPTPSGTRSSAPSATRAEPGLHGLALPRERPATDYPMNDPPRFHVLTDHGQLDLRPWTICGPGYCADGAPDDQHLPDVGRVDHVDFGFDLSGWEFRDVTFRELDSDCPRSIRVAATDTGDRTFRVDPAGPPGRWAVDIFGRGPGGDAVTTVEWTTRRAGSSGPPARGVAAVLADHDGELDSYGVELSLTGLDRWYDDVHATVAVTSETGRSITIPVRAPRHCTTAGDLFLRASDVLGRSATTLGAGPFTYTAEVTLGGTTYVGTGTWPDDVIRGYAPNVLLTWEPALPHYSGNR